MDISHAFMRPELDHHRPDAGRASGHAQHVAVVHAAVASRVRLHVRKLRGSQRLQSWIEEELAGVAGIRNVSASAWTGNVLVHYDQTLAIGHVIAIVAQLASHASGGQDLLGTSSHSHSAAGRPRPKDRAEQEKAERQTAPQPTPEWHCLTAAEVEQRTGCSDRAGLARSVAQERLRAGANIIPRQRPRSSLAILAEQFTTVPVALLAASSVLSLMTGGVADAVVILGVVAINAAIGFATESSAERTVASLSAPASAAATVIRDARQERVPLENVVPGELLVLRPGDVVAADARVIEANNLMADESLLTGESMPIAKTAKVLRGSHVALAERRNMIYRGTAITGGSGLGIVVATGRDTEVGRIQALVDTARPPDTPMQKQLGRIGRQLTWLTSGVCGLVFGLGLLRGGRLLPMLKAAASLAVAAVPEGLPTVATTTLALGIRDMRRSGTLVRRLSAVETLGATQIVCFDKTGTLTLNRMEVARIACAGKSLSLSEGNPEATGGGSQPRIDKDLLRLARISVLCNEAQLDGDGKAGGLNGSPTETALVDMALRFGVDVRALRQRYPVVATDHRSEGRQFMSTLHRVRGSRRLLAVKGSPLAVLNLCRFYQQGEVRLELTPEFRREVARANDKMASTALRVLGCAYGYGEIGRVEEAEALTWVGLLGMTDPTRAGIPQLLQRLSGAGISTVMVTGDQVLTARALANQLGLSNGDVMEPLEAAELADKNLDEVAALAARARVFARVSPRHKLQLIRALQHAGKVVAMTGDGINDGPALRAADLGVAVGRSATDVARDVADVILDDEDPAALATAIGQGRTIYSNIRKALRFLLATNLSEILVMAGGTTLGSQPLTPMQLLWINLISDVFPGLALALEPAEPTVMQEPPRDPKEAILRSGDLKQVAREGAVISASALAAYIYERARYGSSPQASTMAFTTLVTAQLLHALSCRSNDPVLFTRKRLQPNPYLRAALIGSFAVQLLALLVPGLRKLLGIADLSPIEYLVAAGLGGLPLLINEALKTTDRPHGRNTGRAT